MDEVTGWIILCSVLTVIIILLLIAWVFSLMQNNDSTPSSKCFGNYGVFTEIGANILNRCGDDRLSPCNFPITSLVEAQQLCDSLIEFCSAFIYDENSGLMSIVDPNTAFISPSVDLFIRQNGMGIS